MEEDVERDVAAAVVKSLGICVDETEAEEEEDDDAEFCEG